MSRSSGAARRPPPFRETAAALECRPRFWVLLRVLALFAVGDVYVSICKKKALTLYLARVEGRERYFGCNLTQRKVSGSSYQHLMAEAPRLGGSRYGESREMIRGMLLTDRLASPSRPVPKLGPAGIDERTVPLEIKLKL